MARTNIYFPKKLYKKIDDYCNKLDIPIYKFINDVVEEKIVNSDEKIEFKKQLDYDSENIHIFTLRISDELLQKLDLKKLENDYDNRSKFLSKIINEYID